MVKCEIVQNKKTGWTAIGHNWFDAVETLGVDSDEAHVEKAENYPHTIIIPTKVRLVLDVSDAAAEAMAIAESSILFMHVLDIEDYLKNKFGNNVLYSDAAEEIMEAIREAASECDEAA